MESNIPEHMKEHVREVTGYYTKNKEVTDYRKAIKDVSKFHEEQMDILENLIFGHRI